MDSDAEESVLSRHTPRSIHEDAAGTSARCMRILNDAADTAASTACVTTVGALFFGERFRFLEFSLLVIPSAEAEGSVSSTNVPEERGSFNARVDSSNLDCFPI